MLDIPPAGGWGGGLSPRWRGGRGGATPQTRGVLAILV